MTVATVVVGVLLTVALISVVSSTPGHDELHNKQIVLETQIRFLTCLIMIPPEDRTADVIAECQVPPDNG